MQVSRSHGSSCPPRKKEKHLEKPRWRSSLCCEIASWTYQPLRTSLRTAQKQLLSSYLQERLLAIIIYTIGTRLDLDWYPKFNTFSELAITMLAIEIPVRRKTSNNTRRRKENWQRQETCIFSLRNTRSSTTRSYLPRANRERQSQCVSKYPETQVPAHHTLRCLS
jgi:hypothetical protein